MSQDRISDTGLVVTRNAAGNVVLTQSSIKRAVRKIAPALVESYSPAQVRAFARIKNRNDKERRRLFGAARR